MKRCFMPLGIFFIVIFIILFPIALGLFAFTPSVPDEFSNLHQVGSDMYIKVFDVESLKSEYVELEDYLCGVVAAEMPASFEKEALKAQAVAARSYILSRLNSSSPAHPSAVVCNNPSHCKAYKDKDSSKKAWGPEKANQYWDKICSAVAETSGEYMVCDEQIVEAFFFAKSGGRTENSEDIWGESRPYLKSVASPEDTQSKDFYSFREFTAEEFKQKLGLSSLNLPITADKITRTKGGSVNSISINGKTFSGKDIRSIFGLKSANFEIISGNNTVTFKVSGYGHGVGMSQSGANQMAKNGKNYTEILTHYYTNIQIMKL